MHNNGHVNNSPKMHSLTLCVPVSVTYRQCHHSVEELKRGTIHCVGKDCWKLSCMVTETSTFTLTQYLYSALGCLSTQCRAHA